ncbi:MAG: MmgE/PrpD family protein [Candidatus Caldarchaeum sp.]
MIFRFAMNTMSEELASYVEALRLKDIPERVLAKAKLHLLDTVGVSAAGSLEPRVQSIADTLKKVFSSGESTVLWYGCRAPSPIAALANGSMAHALDYDDTHLDSIMHLSSPLVSIVLSLGEALHVSGAEAMTALVAAYEVSSRIGMAVRGRFHERGFHATSVCGVLGCALAAGKLMGHSQAKLAGAMGIAGSMSSGLMEFLSDGSWIKPLHAGWAAHGGIMAALLAAQGLAGPRTILEGGRGVYAAYAGVTPSLENVVADLGEKWEVMNISFKLFPNCHLIHEFMHAALTLKKKHNIHPDEVREITCYVSELAIPIICQPAERKLNPQTRYDAMFSLPYGVATVLVKGSAGIKDFDVKNGLSKDVASLTKKIRFVKAETNEEKIAEIVTVDGRRYTANRSDLENPTTEDIMNKFRNNLQLVVREGDVRTLANVIMNVDKLDVLEKLVRLCVATNHVK